jgi:lysophospholipase L1-like esterase
VHAYRSYVAIGDSLSEGLGDFTFDVCRDRNGWTDRLALLLKAEAAQNGHTFEYANLALRGSKLRTIIGPQLEAALRLQPDLVSVMAGSNDFMAKNLDLLEQEFRAGLQLLQAAGCDVIVATTIRPTHLRFFAGVVPRARRMSEMIHRVAEELQIPVLDVFNIQDFQHLGYWADDMVHFSGHGHIKVANEAARILGLSERIPEAPAHAIEAPPRDLISTLRWYREYVIPFIGRRLRGASSGDGMSSKHSQLIQF